MENNILPSEGEPSGDQGKAPVMDASPDGFPVPAPDPPVPSSVKLPVPRSHKRTVSWNEAQLPTSKSIDAPNTPPRHPLSAHPPRTQPSLSPLPVDGEGASPTSGITNPPSRNVKLSDVLEANPLETEAESFIIDAIEARQRSETATSSILGSVPDTAVFSPEPDADMATAPAAPTAKSRWKAAAKASLEQTKSSPLLQTVNQAVAANKEQASTPTRHRRDQTMEETLFGLTAQLADYNVDGSRHSEPSSVDINSGGGAADALALNANLLFRGKRADASEPTAGKAATTNWMNLKTAVQASVAVNPGKKNKEEMPSDAHDDDSQLRHAEAGLASSHLSSTIRSKHQEHRKRLKLTMKKQGNVVKDFRTFVGQRRSSALAYIRFMFLIILPAIGLSLILFYLAGNPPTGRIDLDASNSTHLINQDGEVVDPTVASASWWILFFVRQFVTFTVARGLEVVIIDFFCLSTRIAVNLMGDLVTLFIIQSRGWPFWLTWWSIINFVVLSGTYRIAEHWLYWQDLLKVFNEENPSGGITANDWNHTALAMGVTVGLVVTLKRLWMGLYLGRKTFTHYSDELAKVMKKILLLCQIAALARDIESRAQTMDETGTSSRWHLSSEALENYVRSAEAEDHEGADSEEASVAQSKRSVMTKDYNALIVDPSERDSAGGLAQSQRMKLVELLGSWEEPEKAEGQDTQNITINAILQFRQSLSYMDNRFMFSIPWGDVSTRDNAVLCSQEVYQRLLAGSPYSEVLSFETIAKIATRDGELDQEKIKDLIRLMRPDREGNLRLLDFVKSVDTVYKEARLLRASVKSSEKIDQAFERVINIVFYIIMFCFILSNTGFDPFALFLSLSSIILAFAFMIGSAAAKMFEGWLFILVRRPYDIGDRVNFNDPMGESSPNGSPGWIIQDVTLFTTTAIFGTTNERATFSNGALASARVINMARSPKGVLYVNLKFAVGVQYEKIKIFEEAVRSFVKARPREWANFLAFRAGVVAADLGYIEYVCILQHRESWQSIGALLTSKAEVSSFCLELSKKLDMRYESPPMPVDLAFSNRNDNKPDASVASQLAGLSAESDQFRSMMELLDRKSR